MMYIHDNIVEFEITPDQIKGGDKKSSIVDPQTIEFANKTKHCTHEPKMYSCECDTGLFGDRILYFCVCKKCGIGTKGYHNPIEAVRGWDKDDVYIPNRVPDYKDSKLVYG